jgi:hypothetical protein
LSATYIKELLINGSECKGFVTSVVLGSDLVSRMSFLSLNSLRNDILDCISRARVNKMVIMQAIFRDFDSDDLMYRAGQEPDSLFKLNVAAFKVISSIFHLFIKL